MTPRRVSERIELARRSLQQGDAQQALHQVKRALLADPTHQEASHLLFQTYVRLGRPDDARTAGYRVLELGGANSTLRLELARIELACGRPNQTVELLKEQKDEDRAASALLAAAYDQLGRPVAAEALRFALQGGLQADPSQETQRMYFAKQLADLLETDPSDKSTTTDLVTALREGRYAEAATLFQTWTTTCDDDALLGPALADWSLMQGQPEEAERILNELVLAPDDSAPLHNRLGDAAVLRGNLGDARHHYRKATLIDRSDWNAWLDLARTEFLLGDEQAAAKACETVLSDGGCSEEEQFLAERFLKELETEHCSDAVTPGLFGLVWWERGGGLTQVETSLRPRQPGLVVTGNVGRLLEDAARVAFQFVQTRYDLFSDDGAHIHFPNLQVAKDGGSAGLLIAASLVAAARQCASRDRVGITGEITLTGQARPIGGLREKIIAAHLHGLARVFFPALNQADLLHVPASARRTMELAPVDTFDDLERRLW